MFRVLYVRFVLQLAVPKTDNCSRLFMFVSSCYWLPKYNNCSGLFMFVSTCYRPFRNEILLRALYVRFVLLLTIQKWDNYSGLFMLVCLATDSSKVGLLFRTIYVRFVLLLTISKWDTNSGLFMFILSLYWQLQSRTLVPGSLCLRILSC